jgi:serine/threonine protein kinase
MANNPFLMDMEYVFNTKTKVIYIMKFFRGGDLFLHLQTQGTFTEDVAKFYAAQMTLAVGYLHSQNIIYRDLKLENILLDDNGYLVLIDFGVSKQLADHRGKAFSVRGTPEYMAPEVIGSKGHGLQVDWWALGTVLFEMLHGEPPFYQENQKRMFNNI